MPANKRKSAGARPYHHGDLRRALIDAALAILNDEQTWDFTLRELARRAGVSHAAPYKHFTDKQALLCAVAAVGFDALRARTLEAAAAHPDDPLAQLRAIGEAYVMFAVERPAHFRLMFGPTLAGETGSADLRAAAGASRQVMADIVQRCIDAGLLGGEAELQVLAAWSLVHGLAMLLIDGRVVPGADPRTVAGAVTRAFVGRLLRGPAGG